MARTARKYNYNEQRNTNYTRELKLEEKLSSRAKIKLYTFCNVMLGIFMFCCSIAHIYVHSNLAVLTKEASNMTVELQNLQSKEITLNAQMEKMFNLEYVEEYATEELGMIKLDQNQIEQIHIQNEDIIEKNDTISYLQIIVTIITDFFASIWEYIS